MHNHKSFKAKVFQNYLNQNPNYWFEITFVYFKCIKWYFPTKPTRNKWKCRSHKLNLPYSIIKTVIH